jgi:hypothetical protein
MAASGIGADVSESLHRHLLPYCSAEAAPHPSDSLQSFYGIDEEELHYLAIWIAEDLSLATPASESAAAVINPATVLDLALHLEGRTARCQESSSSSDMQKPPEIRRLA